MTLTMAEHKARARDPPRRIMMSSGRRMFRGQNRIPRRSMRRTISRIYTDTVNKAVQGDFNLAGVGNATLRDRSSSAPQSRAVVRHDPVRALSQPHLVDIARYVAGTCYLRRRRAVRAVDIGHLLSDAVENQDRDIRQSFRYI